MNLRRSLLLLSLLCVLCLGLAVLGCSKATPVAPNGTTLAISANPARIDTTGSSTITVFGQKANGSALDPGTIIRFSTDKGTIDATATIKDGQATAILHGDGTTGTATVTATAGASSMTMTKVVIGPARVPTTITLQATPPSIDNTKNTNITLLAIVRDDQGQPLPGAQVDFQTDLGTLASGGGLKTTDANGQVTDTLTVKSVELMNNISSFNVRVQTAGGTGSAVTGMFAISVRTAAPVANFTYTPLGSSKVQFNNTSTGSNLTFTWDFGDDTSGSTEISPQHQYTAPGTYNVTLVATSNATNQASTKTQQIMVK